MRRNLSRCNNSVAFLIEDDFCISPESQFRNFKVSQKTYKRDVRLHSSKSSSKTLKRIPLYANCKLTQRKLSKRQQRDRSTSSENSKSSLVILYGGDEDEVASSYCSSWSSQKVYTHSSFQCEPTVSNKSRVPQRRVVTTQSKKNRNIKSNPNSKSKNTIVLNNRFKTGVVDQSLLHSELHIKCDNVNCKIDSNKHQENWRRCCLKQIPVDPITKEKKYNGNLKREIHSRLFDLSEGNSKLMAQRPNLVTKTLHNQKSENFNPKLGILMEHLYNKTSKESEDNQASLGITEPQKIFPFQSATSANVKIVPNQVVFESKKVSVVVAEPRQAKVTIKTEQSCNDQAITRQQHYQQKESTNLTPVLPASIVNRSQIRTDHKLLDNTENPITDYRPRTQPFNRTRVHQRNDMEEDSNCQSCPQRKPVDEVPLSTLGFTFEQPIDWRNITLPEKTDLYQELSRRITSYKNADCIVRIGNDEFHCHLLVLQSYSTFFDSHNVKEIELAENSVTSRAFSVIYDWMISPTSESCHLLRRDNILEIFLAAQNLGIKELEEQCWAFIDNDELFSEDTAFLLYLEARKIGNTAVMELMLPRIMNFFLILVSTKDFLELSVEELCLLLRSNYICVNSEMEVLMSAVRWLMHNWEDRKQYLYEVLKCIRFGLIAPWQLVDVKRNPENPEFMELMSYPDIQKMVDDGLAFVIIKYWYGNRTEDYYHWIDLLGLTEPTNRNWAGEDKNYVTYREFLLYLEEFQKTKIVELKCKKLRIKPLPPDSPPKEDSSSEISPPPEIHLDYQNLKVTDVSYTTNHSTETLGNDVPRSVPTSMMVPPVILNQYINNMGKIGTKSVNKTTNNFSRTKN